MKTVIMAGGKGTRIASVNADVPKPMLRIFDKPILQYQIECLREQRYTDIIIVIGHLGKIIEDYFENGKKFGVHISYIKEEEPLGTAGALYWLKGNIQEDFLLINGDIIFDIDIDRFYQAHVRYGGMATVLAHPNNHPYDSSVIEADENQCVVNWLNKDDRREWYKNRVNAGLHILSPRVLNSLDRLERKDLDRDILKPLIKAQELFVYDSPEYIRDMGTPDRYYAVSNDIASGLVKSKNLSHKQRAVFLDRDGTINQYRGFLTDIDSFGLIEGVTEAIQILNKRGYLVIVVTNQPAIARGELSLPGLQKIHNKMETLLGQEGAYIDDLYFCPHHPEKGFKGERIEYKVKCECRKPNPGMLIAAARKYNIELNESWMIGDKKRDIETGKNAGCKVALVGNEGEKEVPSYSNLLACVKDIFCN